MTDLNLANFQTVWADSFNDPKNSVFGNHWGPGVDLSTPGQITLHTTADNQDSGTMQQSSGASSNQGYGLYSETLQMQGTIGVYGMAGWPASDNWPGPELDMVEVLADGTPYASVHWKGTDGSDQDRSIMFKGVDVTQVHNYQMDWQADHVSFYVDGKEMGTVTDHVPLDYAHGGENESMGIGVQTSWNSGALGGNNWITITDASYSKFVGGGTSPIATSTATTSAASTDAATPSSVVSASTPDTAATSTSSTTAATGPTDGSSVQPDPATSLHDVSNTGSTTTSSSAPADASVPTSTTTTASAATTDTQHSTATSVAPSSTTSAGTTTGDTATTSNTFDFASLKHDHGSHGRDSFHFSDLSSSTTATAGATSTDTTTYSGQGHHDWMPDSSHGHNDLSGSLNHHGHDAWA